MLKLSLFELAYFDTAAYFKPETSLLLFSVNNLHKWLTLLLFLRHFQNVMKGGKT